MTREDACEIAEAQKDCRQMHINREYWKERAEKAEAEAKLAKEFIYSDTVHVSLGDHFEGRITGYEAAAFINGYLKIGRQILEGKAVDHDWNDSGGPRTDVRDLAASLKKEEANG